jgi:N-acetyl-1-D-myo-inositol-2-amino-2-deoxy-alpha-D-glucopyranoside deacetylase
MTADTAPDRRLLLVHAHPDDETINSGATMAKYAAEGVQVTLVTCTLGEEGEILVDSLAHLAADKEDNLGRHRIGELTDAMQALGVKDFRFLGGPGRFRDTGMAVDERTGAATAPPVVRGDTFWAADLVVAADLLVEIIREVRPQVLLTYDEYGGYGHPDHIQAHRVAMYASLLAAAPSHRRDLGPAWDITKIYWSASSEERMRASLRHLRAAGDTTTFEGLDPEGPLLYVVADDLITTDIDAPEFVEAKMAALAAHASQISLDGPFFAMSNRLGNEVMSIESYRLVRGPLVVPPGAARESDLFAGLA